jgi:hypothetical protein
METILFFFLMTLLVFFILANAVIINILIMILALILRFYAPFGEKYKYYLNIIYVWTACRIIFALFRVLKELL